MGKDVRVSEDRVCKQRSEEMTPIVAPASRKSSKSKALQSRIICSDDDVRPVGF